MFCEGAMAKYFFPRVDVRPLSLDVTLRRFAPPQAAPCPVEPAVSSGKKREVDAAYVFKRRPEVAKDAFAPLRWPVDAAANFRNNARTHMSN
jgi:hypothetical protein